MRTHFYIAYRNAGDESVDSVGCFPTEKLDRKFLHDLLDEFIDGHKFPGNTSDLNQTCFQLNICDAQKE
jgi:hypothetical protein